MRDTWDADVIHTHCVFKCLLTNNGKIDTMQQNISDYDDIEKICEEKEKNHWREARTDERGLPYQRGSMTQETKFIISPRKYELLKLVQEETDKLNGSRSI